MDDQILLQKISEGDQYAFNMLVDRYYDALCAFAFQFVGSFQAAEDVVQDALVRLWTNRSRISDVTHAKTYIYTVVKNLALTHLRANARRHSILNITDPEEEDISRHFIEQETFRMVTDAIDRLPPRTAEIIRLSLEGVRQQKIGERMGITVATVKSMKADGLKTLRQLLDSLKILTIFG